MSLSTQGFSRSDRLRKRREFLRVERESRRAAGANFVVLLQPRPSAAACRLGVTVSRRVGGAVVRNRVKRRVRETFRRERHLIPTGDTVVIARTGAGTLSFEQVGEELRRLWQQAAQPRSR